MTNSSITVLWLSEVMIERQSSNKALRSSSVATNDCLFSEVYMVYATPYNFMGRVLYEGLDEAYLVPEAIEKLKKALNQNVHIRTAS